MDILLGLQWGDEGKGKIVDFLAPKYNLVARFQGGPNAGHTLNFGGQKHVLHQVPSGIFRSDIKNVIGNGVVLDLVILKNEITALQERGAAVKENLYISKKAHLILPTHRLLDAAYEKAKGDKKIGSTLKGIGPTYQDKIGRLGLRVGDLCLPNFRAVYKDLRTQHLQKLEYLNFGIESLPELEENFFQAVDFIKEFQIIDSEYIINQEINDQKKVLAEGAQGTLLDIDFGSYPFVTSSNTSVAGACTGLGVAPQKVLEVFGIFKAYCTRVGSGPFPTELFDEVGAEIAKIGNEFGATTGRPRRCGWLDLPALKYTVMLNGVTQLFMMKADVLSTFEEIKVCTHYELADGTKTDIFPYDLKHEDIKPIYRTFKGWQCELKDLDNFEKLPKELSEYIAFIQEVTEVPITVLSYGADREATLLKHQF